jgi:hypothetical protein
MRRKRDTLPSAISNTHSVDLSHALLNMKFLPTIIPCITVAAALPASEIPIYNDPKATRELVHPAAVNARRAIEYGFSQSVQDLGKLPSYGYLSHYSLTIISQLFLCTSSYRA